MNFSRQDQRDFLPGPCFPVDLSPTVHTLPGREIICDNTSPEHDSSCLEVFVKPGSMGSCAMEDFGYAPRTAVGQFWGSFLDLTLFIKKAASNVSTSHQRPANTSPLFTLFLSYLPIYGHPH